ncbi:UDENN domain-containing protein [Aphelenchoides besseyi]|nr:UDENN domain-containing protein [Aphelenchoides besseyi]KAI6200395.1 UDENN domain-containing protein [Aphelenchoides besseyi]
MINEALNDEIRSNVSSVKRLGTDSQPTNLTNQQLNDFVKCICLVTFDVDHGQTIEAIYPPTVTLSDVDRANISYNSFPDTTSSCPRDTTYHFRYRTTCPPTTLSEDFKRFNQSVPVSLQADEDDFVFGFVHFRFQKQIDAPRGYFQKSVVVLSRLPLFALFKYVVDVLAYGFFDAGEPIIEAACEHIKSWPSPIPSETLCMPLLGQLIVARIPCLTDLPHRHQLVVSSHPNPITISQVYETNFYESTKSILVHLQLLWELVIIGESIIVITPNPSFSSEIVQSLVSLIWPIRYYGDFRPFMTIHDSDFHKFTSVVPAPSAILGVTNPFFAKALNHWPNLLRIGDPVGQTFNADRLFKKTADGKLLDLKPGLYTRHRPFLNSDRSLAKKLSKIGERPDAVQNSILRRHFLELTQSFTIPLERYLSSLMPLKKNISPFKSQQMRPFELDDFLSTITQTGPLLTCGTVGKWSALYKRFVGSPNFDGWLRERLKEVDRQLNCVYLDVVCDFEFTADVLREHEQIEVVDLVLRLRDLLSSNASLSDNRRSRLQRQLETILNVVDEDLQLVLMSNGPLRDLVEA